jgi:hypothetical protein
VFWILFYQKFRKNWSHFEISWYNRKECYHAQNTTADYCNSPLSAVYKFHVIMLPFIICQEGYILYTKFIKYWHVNWSQPFQGIKKKIQNWALRIHILLSYIIYDFFQWMIREKFRTSLSSVDVLIKSNQVMKRIWVARHSVWNFMKRISLLFHDYMHESKPLKRKLMFFILSRLCKSGSRSESDST